MRVDARAHRRAAERQLGQARLDRAPAGARPLLHLRGIARELLPEPDRHRVLQVGAADLDDLVELLGLALQSASARRLERRDPAP